MSKLLQHNQRQREKRVRRAQRMQALIDAGRTVKEIAAKRKITKARVYHLLASLRK